MISLDWFLKEFATNAQLYMLMNEGMKLISEDHGKLSLDDFIKVTLVDKVLAITDENVNFDRALRQRKKVLFLEALEQENKKELFVDAMQVNEFLKKHPDCFDEIARTIFFVWKTMPEVKRLYNAITSKLTISDEDTDHTTWSKMAINTLKNNSSQDYKFLKSKHVEDTTVFIAPDRQQARDIPGNLVKVLLKDYLSVEKISVKKINTIYRMCPPSFKPVKNPNN